MFYREMGAEASISFLCIINSLVTQEENLLRFFFFFFTPEEEENHVGRDDAPVAQQVLF